MQILFSGALITIGPACLVYKSSCKAPNGLKIRKVTCNLKENWKNDFFYLGGAVDVQASLRGGSSKGGRFIFDEALDCRRFDGDPKNKFACDGLEDLRLTCSGFEGDKERASRLIALRSLMGLGDRECFEKRIVIVPAFFCK